MSICSKRGCRSGSDKKHRWLIWLFPVAGLVSLIWFLIRVIPKPSRATYPCQRVAMPLASGFVLWVTGVIGSTFAYRKGKELLRRSHLVKATVYFSIAVICLFLVFVEMPDKLAIADNPIPNVPIGDAKGVRSGRVVWVYEPNATDWEGPGDGHWWESSHTNQASVDQMMSRSIRELVGESSDSNAWDGLFRNFNQTHGKGDVAYQPGEKITIKVNLVYCIHFVGSVNTTTYELITYLDYMNTGPQMMLALLRQLVYEVGVNEADISIGDTVCYFPNQYFNDCNDEFPNVNYLDYGGGNELHPRTQVAPSSVEVYWSNHPQGYLQDYVPVSYAEADYLINMANLKSHATGGITVCAKNHYGSLIRTPNEGGYYDLHETLAGVQQSSGNYRSLVDLMGHAHIGGKTMLYLIDGLYAGRHPYDSAPMKWYSWPFNGDWSSSLFASQDPVAIDSVAFDFLRTEWDDPGDYPQIAGTDDYLHEAAEANNPASGTFYDPDHDGDVTRLGSLGTHEHWNNPIDKQYSRNLGTGNGIELVIPLTSLNGPIENITAGKRYDYIRFAINDANAGDELVASEGTYYENIDFRGKNLIVRSTNPQDSNVVASTIIRGSSFGPVVTFADGEDSNCLLSGFTITDGNTGIYCDGASPTITNCVVAGNVGAGIETHLGAGPSVTNCIIAENGTEGIYAYRNRSYSTFTNCTIVKNAANGIYNYWNSTPTITNCIIWDNGADEVNEPAEITYCDIQGGREGLGNIDIDPCFADIENGDYHLQSTAGRWDPNTETWVIDANTSECIDSGNAGCPVGSEPLPNGNRINMGAFGGMPTASKSPADWRSIADMTNDWTVDHNDLAVLGDLWLGAGECLPSDLDRNGIIDLADYAIFANEWFWGL